MEQIFCFEEWLHSYVAPQSWNNIEVFTLCFSVTALNPMEYVLCIVKSCSESDRHTLSLSLPTWSGYFDTISAVDGNLLLCLRLLAFLARYSIVPENYLLERLAEM